MYEILNLNFIVSIVIGGIILIITIMSIVYLKVTKPIVKKNIDLHEDLISRTMNAVYNPKMIEIFNREKKEIDDFNNISDEYRKNDTKLIDYLIYYELIGTGMRRFKDPFIFLIGGLLIINGKMNIGSLMVLMTYSSNLLEYVVQLIYMINDVNGFLVPTNRINNFLRIKEEEKRKDERKINDISIEFINVSIKINSITILSQVSFKIEKGQTIYLVGNNGSGKSILIKKFIPQIVILKKRICRRLRKNMNFWADLHQSRRRKICGLSMSISRPIRNLLFCLAANVSTRIISWRLG